MPSTPLRRWIGTVSTACAVAGAALLAPSIATADTSPIDPTSPGLNGCALSTLTQPFAPWGDFGRYELVPGGDFESAVWTSTGGADRVTGSEPYAATGTRGSYSLSLPRGSSAQSPLTCVDATSPSIRFFVAGDGSVAVNIVESSSVIPAGVVVAGGGWTPTPVMVTSSPLLAAPSGGTAQVSVNFVGLSGSPQVDDVFIDPWSRG